MPTQNISPVSKFWSEAFTTVVKALSVNLLEWFGEHLTGENNPLIWFYDYASDKAKKTGDDRFATWKNDFRTILRKAELNPTEVKQALDGLDNLLPSEAIPRFLVQLWVQAYGYLSTVGGTTGALSELVNKAARRQVRFGVGDFGSLYKANLLSTQVAQFDDGVKDLGISTAWVQRLKLAYQTVISPNDAAEAARRKKISTEDYKAMLIQNGFDNPRFIQAMLDTLYNPIPAEVLSENWRRGYLDDSDYAEGFKLLGYDDKAFEQFRRVSERILDEGTILKGWIRNKISPQDATSKLLKLGYSGSDINTILQSSRGTPREEDLRVLRWRDQITDRQLLNYLGRLGYDDNSAAMLVNTVWLKGNPSDLVRFAVREVYSPDIVEKFRMNEDFPVEFLERAKEVGIPPELAKEYWRAHWDLPSPGQGFDMLHRGIINREDMVTLLRTLDVNPYWRDKMIDLSYNLIPRRTVGMLYKYGIYSIDDLVQSYYQLGYNDVDALDMAMLDIERAFGPEKDLTVGDGLSAYTHGYISENEFTAILKDLRYTPEAVKYKLKEAQLKKLMYEGTAKAEPDSNAAQTAWQSLTRDIQDNYKAGLLSDTDAKQALTNIGYGPEATTYLIKHIDYVVERENVVFHTEQIKRMFQGDVFATTEAIRRLSLLGYVSSAASRIVEQWKAESEAGKSLIKAKKKEPTKAEISKWLKLGVINVDQWVLYMRDIGYDYSDIENYLIELVAETEISKQ